MKFHSCDSIMNGIRDIGSRLELFTDGYLIDKMTNVTLRLHEPQKQPLNNSPLRGVYMTVIKDGDLYRAYYRDCHPAYNGPLHDGNPGEITCYAESRDGCEWIFPGLDIYNAVNCEGSTLRELPNNVILAGQTPFSHNFSPFLDPSLEVDKQERFKALAGLGNRPSVNGPTDGLHAFVSGDGIHWRKKSARAVIPFDPAWTNAFDSQNSAFWSSAEKQYVCYFRSMSYPGNLRGISRTTSPDFEHWTVPIPMNANLQNEHLYTNQTHPYFRAPHIYIALPSRYTAGVVGTRPTGNASCGSTDILFMSSRAGTSRYDRLFTEAFIRPGLEKARWEDRANYAALNIVPTGPAKMSIYHANSGHRYTLRPDGFVSVTADAVGGELLTRPLLFKGNILCLNYSTSAAGFIQVEVTDADSKSIPGFTLENMNPRRGDELEGVMVWENNSGLNSLVNRPIRLRFVLKDADLYGLRFKENCDFATLSEKN